VLLTRGERLSARLRALVEGKTPHGGAAIKVQKPRAADPYTRHAVVAIVGGLRKKGPPRRSDAPTAHAIARGVAALHHGPKLPYFKRTKPHQQTPRGRKYIQKHQKDRNHAAKDAKYYKLVGKRRAEFEGPWTLKGEAVSLSQRLRSLVEATSAGFPNKGRRSWARRPQPGGDSVPLTAWFAWEPIPEEGVPPDEWRARLAEWRYEDPDTGRPHALWGAEGAEASDADVVRALEETPAWVRALDLADGDEGRVAVAVWRHPWQEPRVGRTPARDAAPAKGQRRKRN
jgi:hypothetical protein